MPAPLTPPYLSLSVAFVLLTSIGWAANVEAAEPKTYKDAQGNEVYLPMGDISFADRVVSFQEGKPHSSIKENRNPQLALGPADYVSGGEAEATTLGASGTLILEFVDNALINIEGPDLHVFEVGPDIEPTRLAISKDGTNWVEIGKISGGTASVDLGDKVGPNESYRFVRLTDLKSSISGRWPGADIDAVAAVGSGQRISLNSAVLFAYDKAELKPEAETELNKVINQIQDIGQATLTVEGHTDADGSDAYNQKLSEARAKSVAEFLTQRLSADDYTLLAKGMGESTPVASNQTDEGKAQNRRVEIIVNPRSN